MHTVGILGPSLVLAHPEVEAQVAMTCLAQWSPILDTWLAAFVEIIDDLERSRNASGTGVR